MQFSASHKMIASMVLPLLVFLGGVLLRSHTLWEELQSVEKNRVNEAYQVIDQALEVALEDLRFIRQNTDLTVYIVTGAEGRRKEFEQFLIGLSDAKKVYQQLRYIDNSGMERVRVDNNGQAVSITELSNKKNRYYVENAATLQAGQVFISRLDLNVENGKVEKPLRPMIRLVAPVFIEGKRRGAVVINYMADEFLNKMRDILGFGIEGYVVNKQGYWLIGPPNSFEWGFMFARQETIGQTYKTEWAAFMGGERQIATRNGIFFSRLFTPVYGNLSSAPNSFEGIYIISRAALGTWIKREIESHFLEFMAFAIVLFLVGFASRKVILLQDDEAGRENMMRERLANALQASEKKNTAIVHISQEGILTCNETGSIIDANPAAQKMLAMTKQELAGENIYDFIEHNDGQILFSGVRDFDHAPALNVVLRRKDKTTFHGELIITETLNDGLEKKFTAFLRDVSEQRAYERHLKKLAMFDPLTGLPNRHSLNDCLTRLGKEAAQMESEHALVLVGLDEFHIINDSLGHHIGDEVLISVARLLEDLFRDAVLIVRLTGDEFCVVLQIGNDEHKAIEACERIVDAFRNALKVNSHEIHISMSIGVAFEPKDGITPTDILQHADSAMHRAKAQSRNSFALYTEDMGMRLSRRMLLRNKLEDAMSLKALEVFFQPLIDAKTQKIAGAEALLRWNDAQLGMISPEEFIPVAEKTGLIVPIGEWVLKRASQFAKVMREDIPDFFVAVNVSPIQFMARDLSELVGDILNRYELDADALEIELTEGILLQDPVGAEQSLQNLVNMGVSVSIDDFGTGYSSLSYLSKYPFKTLKIDRAFVKGLPEDKSSKGLASAILSMARELELNVIAEGTETIEQVEWLANAGAHILQGYYFSKPIPQDEFVGKVRS